MIFRILFSILHFFFIYIQFFYEFNVLFWNYYFRDFFRFPKYCTRGNIRYSRPQYIILAIVHVYFYSSYTIKKIHWNFFFYLYRVWLVRFFFPTRVELHKNRQQPIKCAKCILYMHILVTTYILYIFVVKSVYRYIVHT